MPYLKPRAIRFRQMAMGVALFSVTSRVIVAQDTQAISTGPESAKVYYDAAVLPKLSSQLILSEACSPPNPADQNPTNMRWKYSYTSRSPVNWIRPHVTISPQTESTWELIVRDSSGNVADRISSANLFGNEVWTNKVLGDSFSIEATADQRIPSRFCID